MFTIYKSHHLSKTIPRCGHTILIIIWPILYSQIFNNGEVSNTTEAIAILNDYRLRSGPVQNKNSEQLSSLTQNTNHSSIQTILIYEVEEPSKCYHI